jgi:biotin transporter BioY
MKFKHLVTEIAYAIATIIGTVSFVVIGINVLRFVVSGRSAGYDSAQGGGTFYFLLSVLAVPLAIILGIALDRYLARRRRS